jgi:hypothetical protein
MFFHGNRHSVERTQKGIGVRKVLRNFDGVCVKLLGNGVDSLFVPAEAATPLCQKHNVHSWIQFALHNSVPRLNGTQERHYISVERLGKARMLQGRSFLPRTTNPSVVAGSYGAPFLYAPKPNNKVYRRKRYGTMG